MDRPIRAPRANPETEPYWASAGNGKLLIKRCEACGEAHTYPRALCPFCFSDRTTWLECSGRGTIYSFSVMRRAPVPYALAYVTLAEGPTMISNIVDCDFDTLRIGQPVMLVFKRSENGQAVPMFTPSGR